MSLSIRVVTTAFLMLVAATVGGSRPNAPIGGRTPVPPRLDFNGDPLPPGAICRAGALRFRAETLLRQVVFSPDGAIVYAASHKDKFARGWAVGDGRELRRLGGESLVTAVAVSPDGKLVATSGTKDLISVWDAATGRLIRRINSTSASENKAADEH